MVQKAAQMALIALSSLGGPCSRGDFLDPWLFYERKAVVSIHLCFSPEISLDPRGLFGLLVMPTKQQL